MRRIVVAIVALHWAIAFALLAGITSRAGDDGITALLRGLGFADGLAEMPLLAGPEMTFGVALGFAVVAALFFWMLVSALSDDGIYPGDTDEVARVAFGGAVGLLTLMLLASSVAPAPALFSSVALQLGALLISYLVVQTDRQSQTAPAMEDEDMRQAARIMALGAAHSSLLSRIGSSTDEQDREPR